MKIAFHDNILSLRGTSVAIYDWAYWLRYYYYIDVIIIYNKTYSLNDQSAIEKFKKEFDVFGYENVSEIDKILIDNNCDYFFMEKGGKQDGIISNVCKNLVNAISVCSISDIHGDVYAMGSEWLSKIVDFKIPYVPYIVNLPDIDEDLRKDLNIAESDLVLGRNGGYETFDLEFVKSAIRNIINERNDIWFVFQNTEKFVDHERVIFLPGNPDLEYKTKFINTCDAMIHARYIGESFGLSCGEFSIRNKPIITWYDSPERNHIDVLGDHGIYYRTEVDIYNIFKYLTKNEINMVQDWNRYREFSPEKVVKKFKEVYLS